MSDGSVNVVGSRSVSPVFYKKDVPEGFHTDFEAVSGLHCREVWAYSYRCFGISLHSAFVMVMDGGQVYIAEGAPTKSPKPSNVFKFCARSICHRLGLLKDRFDMGYMMPHIYRVQEMAPHVYCASPGGDLEKERPGTLHFEQVVQGKGMDGITFFKKFGTKIVKTKIFTGDNAQKAYQDIAAVTYNMAAAHLAYEFIPSRANGTVNCHTFTEEVLYKWRHEKLLHLADLKNLYHFYFRVAMPGSHAGGFGSGISWINRLIPDMPEPDRIAQRLGAFSYHGAGTKPDPQTLMPYSFKFLPASRPV